MIANIKKLLLFSYEHILWMSTCCSKKDHNIWIFGSMQGQKYLDNARYLFEYVSLNSHHSAIWISKNRELVKELNNRGFQAYHQYSLQAYFYSKKAKVAIVTHRGNREQADLPYYLFSNKTHIIQLWHGIGLKKTAFDDQKFSFKYDEKSFKWRLKAIVKKYLFPYLEYINQPSLVLALAQNTKITFSNAFRIPLQNVQITGYPRNDILLNSASKASAKDGKKKVIYMPTFRGSVNSNFDLFLQYGFDVQQLDTFLEKEQMQLHIKLHPFNQPSEKLLQELNASSNISFLDHDAIYEIISQYDMLITDYSSIYFDYLLLDRPIIFAPFDQDDYLQNDREFYFEYDEVTPGPKAMSWPEVMTALQQFNQNPKAYDEKRQQIKNRFHTYQDNQSTQRVYEAILKVTQ